MDMTHIKVIKSMEYYRGGIKMENISVIFNSDRITESDVRKCIDNNEYSPFLIKLPVWQFELIFNNNKI